MWGVSHTKRGQIIDEPTKKMSALENHKPVGMNENYKGVKKIL
jgi:hypothetical protein